MVHLTLFVSANAWKVISVFHANVAAWLWRSVQYAIHYSQCTILKSRKMEQAGFHIHDI